MRVAGRVPNADWHAFSVEDQLIVTILLPAAFSGQEVPMSLQGMAIVSRVDPQKRGVALRFERDLKFFERVNAVRSLEGKLPEDW